MIDYRQYLDRGWAVVPVARGAKSPQIDEWPRLAAERAFAPVDFAGKNIGVVLGYVSNGLTDIDLDSRDALALAPYVLPPTPARFGRASKPDSHWLYYAHGARSQQMKFGVKPYRELIEIRSTNAASDGCGHQTVFPGSIHESGETIEWSDGLEEPATVDTGELLWAVCRLAVGSIILRDWGEGSGRHEKSLALAGGLLKAGWTADETRDLLAAVRACSGDSPREDADFAHDVETTIAAFARGETVTGLGSLVASGCLDAQAARDIEAHARTPEQRAREVKLHATRHGLREAMLAEARSVDGMLAASERIAALSAPVLIRPGADAIDTAADWGLPIVLHDTDDEPPPLEYICGPFAAGKVSAITAYAYTAKTPFALAMALHIASGRDYLGLETAQRRALYLAFEGARNARRKAKRLIHGMGLASDTLHEMFAIASASSGVLDETFIAQLAEQCVARDVGAVFLDTYGAALDPSVERNAAAFAIALKQLGDISEQTGILFVALLHNRKTVRGTGAVGSPGLEQIDGHNSVAGALQAAITLTRPDGADKNLIRVECSRAPDEEFAPFSVRWEDVDEAGRIAQGGARLKPAGLRVVIEGAKREAPAGSVDAVRAITDLLREEHALGRTRGLTLTELTSAARARGVAGDVRLLAEQALSARTIDTTRGRTPGVARYYWRDPRPAPGFATARKGST